MISAVVNTAVWLQNNKELDVVQKNIRESGLQVSVRRVK